MNTYENRISSTSWQLGLMTSVTENSYIVNASGETVDTRVKKAEYRYNENGLRTMELSNLGDDNGWHIQYDEVNVYGETFLTSIEGHGLNGSIEMLNQEVDARGRFVVKEASSLGDFTEYTYDHRFGSLATAVDAHGLESCIMHDEFGRDIGMVKSNGCSMS